MSPSTGSSRSGTSGFIFYSGNYEKYLARKTERRAQLEAAYRNQRERIEQLEAFINRFRYQATKAKQVQSRIKELEKIERIEIAARKKRPSTSLSRSRSPAAGSSPSSRASPRATARRRFFATSDFTIERGDRIALVGVNGAGKSTLIKLLAGAEPLTAGEYKLGHNVQPDYFAQDQYKELDPDARMLDDLGDVAPRSTQTELRSLLGCFLFSEDDVFKRIGVLSGGERNRYALARMLLHPANFLLLDEPTNHLDMRAKDVLLKALSEFTGTVVFVSHDRYFIDKLATRVFEIGDGRGRSLSRQLRGLSLAQRGRSGCIAEDDCVSGKAAAQERCEWQFQRPEARFRGRRRQAPEPHQTQADGRTRSSTRGRDHRLEECPWRSTKRPCKLSSAPKKPTSRPGVRYDPRRTAEPDGGMGATEARRCKPRGSARLLANRAIHFHEW